MRIVIAFLTIVTLSLGVGHTNLAPAEVCSFPCSPRCVSYRHLLHDSSDDRKKGTPQRLVWHDLLMRLRGGDVGEGVGKKEKGLDHVAHWKAAFDRAFGEGAEERRREILRNGMDALSDSEFEAADGEDSGVVELSDDEDDGELGKPVNRRGSSAKNAKENEILSEASEAEVTSKKPRQRREQKPSLSEDTEGNAQWDEDEDDLDSIVSSKDICEQGEDEDEDSELGEEGQTVNPMDKEQRIRELKRQIEELQAKMNPQHAAAKAKDKRSGKQLIKVICAFVFFQGTWLYRREKNISFFVAKCA
jgi:hypothetical protein